MYGAKRKIANTDYMKLQDTEDMSVQIYTKC